MISDKLYELAFEYKKTKLWEILWDTELFAVKLSGGRIGYISIMGAGGEYCALALYIGEEGFRSFCETAKADRLTMAPIEFQEYMLRQNCLQCAFEGKDELSEQEREETKAYARAHGIRIAGRNAYPHFLKYQPYCVVWNLQDSKEQEDLCAALEAAIELSKRLEMKMPGQLGLERMRDDLNEVPMLEKDKNGVYQIGKAELPKGKPKKWPSPVPSNDIDIAKLKKAKRKGVWECEIIHFPSAVQNGKGEIPVFPALLLAAESSTDFILPVSPAMNYEKEPEELLKLCMDAFLSEKICPAEIKARDERTCSFFQALCHRLKVPVSIEKELPALDDAESEFLEHFSMDEEEEMDAVMNILNEILGMDKKVLRTLPDELVDQLMLMVEQGILPEDMEQKLRKAFGSQKAVQTKQSYVISVSLGTGCYRHIRISGRSRLIELHEAILEAFGFMDDHAHAFFMDNTAWSERDCYYMEGIESYYRTTGKYTLNQVGLYKGMQFKYIFDFGDEWTFQCKVLRVLEESTDAPVIIRSKGDAPEQYPDWEDEWEDDEDD